MQVPDTRYALSGDVSIAYQVSGDGPFDIVYVPPFASHVELAWQIPGVAAHFRRLGSFARLIRFDKRGTGMSDRVGALPTLETRMDDVRAVMDAAGSGRRPLAAREHAFRTSRATSTEIGRPVSEAYAITRVSAPSSSRMFDRPPGGYCPRG